jgi:hypothetical protein
MQRQTLLEEGGYLRDAVGYHARGHQLSFAHGPNVTFSVRICWQCGEDEQANGLLDDPEEKIDLIRSFG